MKATRAFIFVILLCPFFMAYGQIPNIVILPSNSSVDTVYPHVFRGNFYIDSISDIDAAYLIYVTSADTIKTDSKGLFSITTIGVPYTVISFKDNTKSDIDTIYRGDTYMLTLSPPGGIWTLYGCEMYNSNSYQLIRDPQGYPHRVPLTSIKTQLMLSIEIKGLHYDCMEEGN